jgi:hypothetical protein
MSSLVGGVVRSVGIVPPREVGFDRHGHFFGQFRVAVGAEDRLAAEYDDVAVTGDAGRGSEDVGELVSVHCALE